MDTLKPHERSERMRRIKSKDTKPELSVRKLIYSMGYRYRLHDKRLPGRPDLVFSGRRKVIFIHGCFWHRHNECRLARLPKSRLDFWQPKLEMNAARDVLVQQKLIALGWTVMTVWECEVADEARLRDRIYRFLNDAENN